MVPFMVLDLLTKEGQQGKVKHLYHHNLESFMWVFTWIFLHYRQGVPLQENLHPLDEWATPNFSIGHRFVLIDSPCGLFSGPPGS
ncbi:hypothetical protein BDR06DRAFT_947167 [Suillus hirtellus]|nr:hypothetical protein BDR06DRAFT_947167 [Suillus hirtellus]